MTSQQIASVKASWQTIASLDAVIVGQIFYTRLLGVNPELKILFKSSTAEQSKKLVAMLGYVINKLEKLEDITEDIQRMAQRHVKYGVKETHYHMVGASLIWTLKKGLGQDWNDELETAWTRCYTMLSSSMIDASHEASFN